MELKKWKDLSDEQKLYYIQQGLKLEDCKPDPDWDRLSNEEKLEFLRLPDNNNISNNETTDYRVPVNRWR